MYRKGGDDFQAFEVCFAYEIKEENKMLEEKMKGFGQIKKVDYCKEKFEIKNSLKGCRRRRGRVRSKKIKQIGFDLGVEDRGKGEKFVGKDLLHPKQ